jgi:DNA modification methylase
MLIKDIKIGETRRKVDPIKVKELAGSIKEIGLLNPVTVTENSNLIAGAHRIEAFKLLGREEIPHHTVSLNSLQVELAEIDENLIRNEIHFIDRGDCLRRRKEIYEALYPETKKGAVNQHTKVLTAESAVSKKETFAKNTANKTGISDRTIQVEIQIAKNVIPEVKEIIKQNEITKENAIKLARMEAEQQIRVAKQLESGKGIKEAVKTVKREELDAVRVEEITLDTENIALFGVDALTELKKLEAASVDLVVTDPPYGVDYRPSRDLGRPEFSDKKEETLDYLDLVFAELKRVCKPNAHLYIFSGCANGFEFKQLLAKYFYVYDNPIIWVKNNHTLCDFENRYASKYEWVWFCKCEKGNARKLNNSCSPDVLEFAKPINKYHDCQKPIALLKYFIENSSFSNETVLDPFAGSGSTLIAACEASRKYIGFELETEYELRLKNELGRK